MMLTATIHRRTLVVLSLLAALVGSMVGPTAAMAGGGSILTPIDSSTPITFFGRGWGHGVGMSQYGARGRALAGQTATEILAHYYAGTTLGTTNPMSSRAAGEGPAFHRCAIRFPASSLP